MGISRLKLGLEDLVEVEQFVEIIDEFKSGLSVGENRNVMVKLDILALCSNLSDLDIPLFTLRILKNIILLLPWLVYFVE